MNRCAKQNPVLGVFLSIALLLASMLSANAVADVAGSRDHPLIGRFAGSEIIGYSAKDYDEMTFALGPAYEAPSGNYELKKKQRVEGKLTRILYLTPPGKSTLQVFRNFEKTLKGQGFTPVFSCTGNGECGWYSWFLGVQTLGGLREYAYQLGDDFRYLAARLARKEGDVYVSMLVYKYDSSVVGAWEGRTMVELNVVEAEPMKEEMVPVKAEDLAKNIKESGHAAVHQIYFDTDSARLKPESDPALNEIGSLLKGDPKLKLYVVGHTDNTGTLAHNMTLSLQRARAVMDALVSRYGAKPGALQAHGVGSLAPVETNTSEAGRAKNRRVDLVRQ